MIDLHAHVLPGLDDGPSDQEESLRMLARAADGGTRLIAATPHLRDDFPRVRVEQIGPACAALQERVPAEWDLTVIPAAEVDLAWALRADDDALRLASYAQRGTDLLVETPYGFLPSFFEEGLDRLAGRGLRIILAHPELNRMLQTDSGRIAALVERGVVMQITGASLLRPASSGRGRLARHLLTSGLAQLIASDAHSAGPWRPPDLTAALVAGRAIAPERVGWMLTVAPAAVLAGKPLPPPPMG